MKDLVEKLIRAANAFDVEVATALFAADAVIDDVSIGERFDGKAGVRKYFETYFVGYHTKTKVVSLNILSDRRVRVQVDFTGDFGHETGVLDIQIDSAGRIARIDAHLD